MNPYIGIIVGAITTAGIMIVAIINGAFARLFNRAQARDKNFDAQQKEDNIFKARYQESQSENAELKLDYARLEGENKALKTELEREKHDCSEEIKKLNVWCQSLQDQIAQMELDRLKNAN